MIAVWGLSFKEWWLAVAVPVAGFLAASAVGALLAVVAVVCGLECRKRWKEGARGRDLLAIHRNEERDDR